MGISHLLFPEMYKAVYKLSRGNLLPKTLESQINAQNQILNELNIVLPFVKYSTENNVKDLQDLEIRSYEEIFPFIDRAWNGEEDVLWPGYTKWFSKSSGTTNARSKYLPVTNEQLDQNHFLASKDMFANYLDQNPNSKIGFDSVLTVSGSIQETNPISGNFAGDISAVIEANSPWWANLSKALPKEITGISSWEERLPKVLEFTKNADIKVLMGVTSWIQIIIKKAVENAGVKNILELWPNLEVFLHGGVDIKPYIADLNKLIPSNNFKYIEVYNASEGFFAFQDTADMDNGMLLMCGHGIYYEFLDIHTNELVKLENLKIHNKYELIISTVSGLWRYRIGDIVEITSTDPVRIRVAGRTKAVLNTFGEELMVGNVDEAIKQIYNEHGYSICEYTGCTVVNNTINNLGNHEWVMEMEIVPPDINKFTEIFDKKLCELNSDYEAKRKGNIVLSLPVVNIVPVGTFYKWMKSRSKLGGQNKVPRLKETNDIVEELKNLTK